MKRNVYRFSKYGTVDVLLSDASINFSTSDGIVDARKNVVTSSGYIHTQISINFPQPPGGYPRFSQFCRNPADILIFREIYKSLIMIVTNNNGMAYLAIYNHQNNLTSLQI